MSVVSVRAQLGEAGKGEGGSQESEYVQQHRSESVNRSILQLDDARATVFSVIVSPLHDSECGCLVC